MLVLFESSRTLGAKLRQLIEARLRFLLRHLEWIVPRAIVRLSPMQADSTVDLKHCRIELEVVGAEKVVASASGRDWRDSAEEAVARAARSLQRQFRRVHQRSS